MAVSMVKIAVPSTLQQSIVHIGILLVQSVINSFGSTAIAGYSAGMRIESLSIVPMLAMGNAMSTFTAQNMGAGKIDRVKEGYRTVSYTHLDVYKRQPEGCEERGVGLRTCWSKGFVKKSEKERLPGKVLPI